MVMNKWLELASLTLTSADLIFSKVSEKGANAVILILFKRPTELIMCLKMCVRESMAIQSSMLPYFITLSFRKMIYVRRGKHKK